jgi:hypothetical protein
MRKQFVFELSDEAVFQRTRLGQRELVWPSGHLSATQRRVLGVVTGYTPLRVVVDLAGGASDMPESIEGLVQMGLIELATDPRIEPSTPISGSTASRLRR